MLSRWRLPSEKSCYGTFFRKEKRQLGSSIAHGYPTGARHKSGFALQISNLNRLEKIVPTGLFCHHFHARLISGRKELFMPLKSVMRIFAAACVLLLGRPLLAQEWDRYQNLDDRFAVTAPGQPTVEK